ncbi:hypothetical protein C0Q70_15552 [Pomacea canaliculata]|uniref:Uncharacterized protein n=1 Tax=Pomacea canaliculata TaxID=400727 RepID=A0A2T7NV76_POMCA|nr:hypothetical protein C0Q70_15552 [Pomacea canaliculata]
MSRFIDQQWRRHRSLLQTFLAGRSSSSLCDSYLPFSSGNGWRRQKRVWSSLQRETKLHTSLGVRMCNT